MSYYSILDLFVNFKVDNNCIKYTDFSACLYYIL